ncbi:phosphoserine phosphatase SerB [Erythrobacter sp. WG]|uniref:phosphoserine phosphatase SerB n=1 Tax=Erythrobacter sp. WG TaxID=2985510 RepID=UPI00226EDAD7|nr:phosphoserine phosphatase SerB [Erythrobacter sp. WG]MCX9146123.1 phosphoserine phosphatase SerB [Erythrobacter sp. WG]
MVMARLIAETGTSETRLARIAERLAGEGGELTASARDGEMLELRCAGTTVTALLDAVDAVFAPAAVLASETEIRVPAVFVSDMDSTMIGQECIDELADYAGLKPQIAAITERAMQGELDFASALRERVGLLEGLDERAIDACLAERVSASPGARTLVATLAALGTRTVLVTGGFHHFADPVGAMLGFHRVVGNRLEVADGRLTGRLVGDIVDSAVKAAVLAEEVAAAGEGALSLATGDGANDIPMIAAASYGFAFKAKPRARAAANGRVDDADLTAVLTLLGIPRLQWRDS